MDSISVDTLTSAHHNEIVNAGEFKTLNDTVASVASEGAVHVALPAGVTEFDATIKDINRDLIIEGKGKDVSTVRSAGPGVFYEQSTDAPGQTLLLRGFALDLDHVPSDRVVVTEGDFVQLLVDDFKALNVNLEDQTDQRGFFEMLNGEVDLVQIDDSEIRFDTIINKVYDGYDEEDDDYEEDEELDEPAEITMYQPAEEDPMALASKEEFEIIWETNQGGDYMLQYRTEAGSPWDGFAGVSTGRVNDGGEYTNTVFAPEEEETYDVRVVFDNDAGDRSRNFQYESLTVEE